MKHLILTAVIMGSLLMSSCKKDPADAPTIPPESSLNVDFSNFEDDSNDNERTGNAGSYWARSIVNVFFWNFALTVNLAVPVASFKEAINHTPKYVSKKKGWLWQYTVNLATGTYTAKLYGKKEAGEVHWKMLISKNGSYEDVEWYNGISKDDNTSGTWTLNKNALSQTAYMQVAWNVDGDKKTIKYTYIESGTEAEGSYIQYGIDPSLSYDRHYNIFGSKENHTINIEWNKSSKIGRIKDKPYYSDANWRCWGSDLANTTCPN
ncbi:MAG: hypothetical protein ACJA0Q_000401 [Saprospiraceae bacterium]|jgi:hypothetical protein